MVIGYKFQCRDGDWKYKFQTITNKLCEKYGLHITPAEYSKEPKNMARPQWERERAFSKWIKQDALFCAISAENMEHFIFLLEKLGFEVKQGKHIAVKVPGKKRFTYKSAYLYEQIRKMHELQEAYLVVVKYDVKSYGDLFRLKLRLQRVNEELCKAQKKMYRDRTLQKRYCKTVAPE